MTPAQARAEKIAREIMQSLFESWSKFDEGRIADSLTTELDAFAKEADKLASDKYEKELCRIFDDGVAQAKKKARRAALEEAVILVASQQFRCPEVNAAMELGAKIRALANQEEGQ